MTSHEINILINLILAIIALSVSLFPVWWLRKHNGDYLSGFRLLIPGLAQASIGNLIFLIIYTMRLLHVFNDADVQQIARPILSIYLLIPFTMVMSLHYWKK